MGYPPPPRARGPLQGNTDHHPVNSAPPTLGGPETQPCPTPSLQPTGSPQSLLAITSTLRPAPWAVRAKVLIQGRPANRRRHGMSARGRRCSSFAFRWPEFDFCQKSFEPCLYDTILQNNRCRLRIINRLPSSDWRCPACGTLERIFTTKGGDLRRRILVAFGRASNTRTQVKSRDGAPQ